MLEDRLWNCELYPFGSVQGPMVGFSDASGENFCFHNSALLVNTRL